MIDYMEAFARDGLNGEPPEGAARNAYRKWEALRDGHLPVFWAVGPNGYSRVFSMSYPNSHQGRFEEVDEHFLTYRG